MAHLPLSLVLPPQVLRSSLRVSEHGAHYRQEVSYEPAGGVIRIHVPPHNDIDESTNLMEQDTGRHMVRGGLTHTHTTSTFTKKKNCIKCPPPHPPPPPRRF